MRHALLLFPALVLLAAAAAASCGGSSSETPWPVEPEQSQLAPIQESLTTPAITEDRPDGGKPKKP
jgi:hypothetical protein